MRTLRRKVLLGVAAVAAIATAGVGIGFTAGADDLRATCGDPTRIYTKGSGGSFAFCKNGDNFELEDLKADSRGVVGYYTIGGMGDDPLYFDGGAGKSKIVDREFREGTKLKIQVCLQKNHSPVGSTCSPWKSVTA